MTLNSKTLAIKILLFIALAFTPSACKISMTFTGASIPEDAKTASVSFFPNQAELVNPDLSNKFTEALKDYIMSNSPLEIVDKGGDMHFEGEITKYNIAPQAIQGDATAAETRLTISVNARFFNKFDPDTDFESAFSNFGDYSNTQSLSDVEESLNDEIIEQLVTDIFNKAFSNW